MKRLMVAALTLGVSAGLAGTTDVAWAGSPDINISAKRPGDPWSDVAAFNLGPGKTKTVKLKVEESTGEVENGVFRQQGANGPGCAGYRLSYFKANGKNITPEVRSPEGFPVVVQPDTPKMFELKVKRRANADEQTVAAVRTIDQNGDTRDAFIDVNGGAAVCE